MPSRRSAIGTFAAVMGGILVPYGRMPKGKLLRITLHMHERLAEDKLATDALAGIFDCWSKNNKHFAFTIAGSPSKYTFIVDEENVTSELLANFRAFPGSCIEYYTRTEVEY